MCGRPKDRRYVGLSNHAQQVSPKTDDTAPDDFLSFVLITFLIVAGRLETKVVN